MVYLETGSRDPYYNLAAEEVLLFSMDPQETYLMLWQNDRTIVVGKYQNTAEELNQAYVDARGIRVARRLSGGGAVYHDLGNLNYTIVSPSREGAVAFDFQRFAQPVVAALARLGVSAQFNGRNDLVVGGKKISGCAQYAGRGRLLHHGCILLNSDLGALAQALRVKEAKIQSKGVKSVSSRVTTVSENAPQPVTVEGFRAALLAELFPQGVPAPYRFSPAEAALVEKLRREKYATWEWNYGYYGDYQMRREKKFPAGLVTVDLDAVGARIQRIRLSGDFWGEGELEQLEAAMVGLPLDGSLKAALERLEVSRYIHGLTAAQLAELLVY